MEQEQPNEVRSQTERTHDDNQLGVRDFCSQGLLKGMIQRKSHVHTWGAEETFDSLQGDGEAQCKQEDSVNQRREDFGPMPAIRVARVDFSLVGELFIAGVNSCNGW